MSIIPLQNPVFARTLRCELPGKHHSFHRLITVSSKLAPAATNTERDLSEKVDKVPIPQISPSTMKFNRLQEPTEVDTGVSGFEFGKFVARQAQLDEEYWTAAWLRAESHWEGRDNDRYVESYKRKFADQEYNSLKQRCNSQLENCAYIVTVKKEDKRIKRTVLKREVGTLDLSIRHLSHSETFPGEHVRGSLFWLTNRKPSGRYAYIANVCVAKSVRRQGIALNMLQFAINSAKGQGVEKVFVHVHRHNKAAQELYQKLGFEVVDEASSQLTADQTYLLCYQT